MPSRRFLRRAREWPTASLPPRSPAFGEMPSLVDEGLVLRLHFERHRNAEFPLIVSFLRSHSTCRGALCLQSKLEARSLRPLGTCGCGRGDGTTRTRSTHRRDRLCTYIVLLKGEVFIA